jgi:aryl-alcohol dehydrogenase-like predicted oxidoreductase
MHESSASPVLPVSSNSRLALGTVQFGLPYGAGARASQVGYDDAANIIKHAFAVGLDTLDTAIAYGESEQRLGLMGVSAWRVISKLPPAPDDCTDVSGYVRSSVMASLQRLNLPRLSGMLLHRAEQLLGPQGDALYRALDSLKTQGLIEKLGVSISSPDQLALLAPRFQLDLIQAPFNIFDRRLATSGWLARLHQAGTEIHIRSVFLQGQLLRQASDRPQSFGRWQPLWDGWQAWLEQQKMTPLQACLGFAMSYPEIDRVVVGVKGLAQFKSILGSLDAPAMMPPESLMSDDQNLINPSLWAAH